MEEKKIPYVEEEYDVVVVGAGHAGCEAALACARLGLETIIFTVSVDSIAMMPCNPNIGGSSKGHLVREIDALGGEMGKNIDKTFIQSKMLNKSKGPAVHSLRAQADKMNYSMEMRKTLQNTDHLTIRQAEVSEIITETAALENGKEIQKMTGVKTFSGAIYHCKAVVLCTGTYLRARCLTGEMITYTGPNGLQAANHLTDSLKAHGIEMFRFKTGTPARADKRSIDFTRMEEQFGDKRVVPFSFTTDPESVQIDQVSCWLTYTNEKLAAGATYTYKIRPVFTAADGESIEGVDSKEAAIALTPAKVKKLKAKGIRGGIQVRWARNKNVTGYQVFMKVHVKGFKTSFNRVKTIKKNKVTGYRCKMLVRGMKYSYRVRAFKTIKGKKIFGPFVMVTAKAK